MREYGALPPAIPPVIAECTRMPETAGARKAIKTCSAVKACSTVNICSFIGSCPFKKGHKKGDRNPGTVGRSKFYYFLSLRNTDSHRYHKSFRPAAGRSPSSLLFQKAPPAGRAFVRSDIFFL